MRAGRGSRLDHQRHKHEKGDHAGGTEIALGHRRQHGESDQLVHVDVTLKQVANGVDQNGQGEHDGAQRGAHVTQHRVFWKEPEGDPAIDHQRRAQQDPKQEAGGRPLAF